MDMEKDFENLEEMEADIVVLEDDDGNEITMEVVDYMFYEGKEYAFLTELSDEENDGPLEGLVMEIRPIEGDDEEEEFVPIDEKLAMKLIELFNTQGNDEDEEFEEE